MPLVREVTFGASQSVATSQLANGRGGWGLREIPQCENALGLCFKGTPDHVLGHGVTIIFPC